MTRLSPAKAVFLLLLALGIAYANSFTKLYLLDDNLWIISNDALPHWGVNVSTSPRPLVSLTLTANYRLGGFHPEGYHVVNLIVHALATLALFGVVRRTMLLPRFGGRWETSALPTAFAVALLWGVHPMNTHAVTYLIQRCESMMGMFYLVVLYATIRSDGSPGPRRWHAAAILSAWAGILCKEVMATAPLVILVYDRMFLASSWRELIRKRWALHLGLWSVFAYPMLNHLRAVFGAEDGQSVSFTFEHITPLQYFYTQAGVLLHYVRLAFWPDALCFDCRDWPIVRTAREWILPATPLALAFLASAYGVWRRHWLGFLGVWFFVILSMTSSFLALLDVANEYRMYLPLAALVVVAVVAVDTVLARLIPESARNTVRAAALAFVAGALVVRTHVRNEDYRTPIAMWQDVLEKRPKNYKIHNHLGAAYESEGKWDEALEQHRLCLEKQAQNFYSLVSMGLMTYRSPEPDARKAGLAYLQKAYSLYNTQVDCNAMLGMFRHLEGDAKGASEALYLAKAYGPYRAMPLYFRGVFFRDVGKSAESEAEFAEGRKWFPDFPEKTRKYALARLRGFFGQSEGINRETIFFAKIAVYGSESPSAEDWAVLADAYAQASRRPEAAEAAQQALALAPAEAVALRTRMSRLAAKR